MSHNQASKRKKSDFVTYAAPAAPARPSHYHETVRHIKSDSDDDTPRIRTQTHRIDNSPAKAKSSITAIESSSEDSQSDDETDSSNYGPTEHLADTTDNMSASGGGSDDETDGSDFEDPEYESDLDGEGDPQTLVDEGGKKRKRSQKGVSTRFPICPYR